jgi:signal transduction histidine kinase
MISMSTRRMLMAVAAIIAVLVFAVWGVNAAQGHGRNTFWPAWAWFGLALPFAFAYAIGWTQRWPAGPMRRVVIAWTVAGLLTAINVIVWTLSWATSGGGGDASFWPIWPLLGLATSCGIYTLIALRNLDPAERRRALAAQVDSLTRTRDQTVDAQAAELGRIERDLHDGAQARLVALSMQLGRAELALEDQPDAQRLVADAKQEAARAISDLRDLSRGIAPPLLADRGLVPAVRALAAHYDAVVDVDADLERRRLPQALERGAYFVVAEALTNAAKHAAAPNIRIRIAPAGGQLVVTVVDDGRGGADPGGSGLLGLRGRVEALGGTLQITSPVGQGTRLEARFPTGREATSLTA